MTYVAGSTQPADIGDPTIITDSVTAAQTLIWSNVYDLAVGETDSIGFGVQADNTDWPVGSTFTDTGTGYASTDPRVVPAFDASGNPIANAAVLPSLPSSASTTVSALMVTKSAEPRGQTASRCPRSDDRLHAEGLQRPGREHKWGRRH